MTIIIIKVLTADNQLKFKFDERGHHRCKNTMYTNLVHQITPNMYQ